MKCYTSKVYEGENYDAIVSSYYGSGSFPTRFYQVLYKPHGDDSYVWRDNGVIYTSKASALRRAKAISEDR